jgi:uncharacterized integral membrane protein
MKHVFLYVVLPVAVLLLIFAAQNAEPANVVFLFWNFETRRVWLLLIFLFGGIGIGSLLTAGFLLGRRSGKRAAAQHAAGPPAKPKDDDTVVP